MAALRHELGRRRRAYVGRGEVEHGRERRLDLTGARLAGERRIDAEIELRQFLGETRKLGPGA